MGKDFKLEDYGLLTLNVTTRGGVIFASFNHAMEPLEAYLGPEILTDFDATFDGRTVKVAGLLPKRAPRQLEALSREPQGPLSCDPAAPPIS